ncbi:hypothetical protein LINPERPRIM_LOCUS19453 [Linum perenne]
MVVKERLSLFYDLVLSSHQNLCQLIRIPPTLSCPAAVMSMENAEAVRAVAVEKSMELDARLIQGQQELASVEAEFSRISEEEEDLEAQIQCLIAKKRQLMNLG